MSIEIRALTLGDAKAFYDCMKALDAETPYMMYEPDERTYNAERLSRVLDDTDSLRLGAFAGEGLIGFLSAERGVCRRERHTAYIVIGIRAAYCHRGIGTRLFEALDVWARENGVTRLELTVETPNTAAVALYKKCGFTVEGVKKNTMYVNSEYVDEYMMAKLL